MKERYEVMKMNIYITIYLLLENSNILDYIFNYIYIYIFFFFYFFNKE